MNANGRRCLVIRNPAAGQRTGRFFLDTLTVLGALGCRIEVRETEGRGDAERIAREACGAAWDVVVAAGGDGTINEVVNGLAGAAMPLAILPLGTANVLAAELGLARDPHAVAKAIAHAAPRPVHLGRAVSALGDRRFILMAGIGYDAHVVRDIDTRLKRRIGKLAYVIEMARQIRRFGFPTYRLVVDGTPIEAASAVVANGRHYGGPYLITSRAALDAPTLAVCLFERGGPWNVLRYGVALVAGLLPRLRDLKVIEAREIAIAGPGGDPVQGDGDIVASLPATLSLAPERLMLIGPA